MRPASLLTISLLAALAPACEDAAPVPFRLHLLFGSDSGGPRHCDQACDAYGLSCGGTLGLRIADARDLEHAHYAACVIVPPAEDLCSLDQLDLELGPLPAGPAHIEVALWSHEALGDEPCLDAPFFDLQGEPLPVTPMPAVAGAIYFVIGAEASARVPMACVEPEQLGQCQERASPSPTPSAR